MGVVLEFRRKPDAGPTPHRLRELREAGGLTQRDLAARVEVPAADIRRFERGERIPLWLRPTLSAVFGVSVTFLLGEG